MAARATSIHFAEQGAGAITLVNRTLAKAEALAEDIRQAAPGCQVQVYSLGDLDLLKQALKKVLIPFLSSSLQDKRTQYLNRP